MRMWDARTKIVQRGDGILISVSICVEVILAYTNEPYGRFMR